MAETLFSENVVSRDVRTDRFETRLLESGEGDGTPVLFVHGNLSSAVWWDEILAGLPDSIRAMAPDLRGYGEAEARPVDATRGLRDFSDDVHALVGTELDAGESFHLVGWSNGSRTVTGRPRARSPPGTSCWGRTSRPTRRRISPRNARRRT